MAYDFNGTTQYFNIAQTPVTGVPLTMAGFYRFDTAIPEGAEETILSLCDADSNQEFTIEIGKNAGVDYAIALAYDGAFNGALSSTPPTINTWQHLLGTFSSAARRDVFLNGTNVGNDTASSTPTGISNVNIGGTLSSSALIKPFNGAIAEVGVWKNVLSNAEIGALAKGMSPLLIRPIDLVFYAPLLDPNNKRVMAKEPFFMTPVANPAPFGHIPIVNPPVSKRIFF